VEAVALAGEVVVHIALIVPQLVDLVDLAVVAVAALASQLLMAAMVAQAVVVVRAKRKTLRHQLVLAVKGAMALLFFTGLRDIKNEIRLD
jgi:hypothetical protein